MLDADGIRALKQSINEVYGGSNGYTKVSSRLSSNRLELTFKAIFQFAEGDGSLSMQKNSLSKQADDALVITAKEAKKAYNEVAKKKITMKEVSSLDDVQLVGTAIYSPKRTAYYTKTRIFNLE